VTMNLIIAVVLSIPVRMMMKHYGAGVPSDLMYNIFQILYYAVF